jgi:hypothetical protein
MFLDTIIKNLCCAAITGATNNLLTGSAGDRNQSLVAFFQSVDALVHITPHQHDTSIIKFQFTHSAVYASSHLRFISIRLINIEPLAFRLVYPFTLPVKGIQSINCLTSLHFWSSTVQLFMFQPPGSSVNHLPFDSSTLLVKAFSSSILNQCS